MAHSSSRQASPLRVATDGDASWRLEARRRRSPACCRDAGRLWWQPVTGRRQCSLRYNMLWTNRLQSFKRGNYPQILLGRRKMTGHARNSFAMGCQCNYFVVLFVLREPPNEKIPRLRDTADSRREPRQQNGQRQRRLAPATC